MTPEMRVLAKEILRYEREVFADDMRDPIHLSLWRTPRALFYKQCALAWRDFAEAVERMQMPPAELWPCAKHHVVGCEPCFTVWLRFHPAPRPRTP